MPVFAATDPSNNGHVDRPPPGLEGPAKQSLFWRCARCRWGRWVRNGGRRSGSGSLIVVCRCSSLPEPGVFRRPSAVVGGHRGLLMGGQQGMPTACQPVAPRGQIPGRTADVQSLHCSADRARRRSRGGHNAGPRASVGDVEPGGWYRQDAACHRGGARQPSLTPRSWSDLPLLPQPRTIVSWR